MVLSMQDNPFPETPLASIAMKIALPCTCTKAMFMLLIIIHNDSEYIVLESQFPFLLCIIFVQVKTYFNNLSAHAKPGAEINISTF